MSSQTGTVDQKAFLKAFVDLEDKYTRPLPGAQPGQNADKLARGSRKTKKTKNTLT